MFYKKEKEAEFKQLSGYEVEEGWYPRVTKIMEIKSKPALYRFYSAVGFDNGEKIKEKSATEGTMVHEAVQKIMIGENPIVPLEIKPAIDAFIKFKERNLIEAYPELIEKRVIHNYFRYAGTVDAIVNLNGRFGVLDIKTSQSIYRDYNLQTAAYFDALKEKFPELSARWILRIDQSQKCISCGSVLRTKGGRKKITKPFPYTNGMCKEEEHVWSDPQGIIELSESPVSHENDFEAFLGAKRLWEWENESILKKIGYL
ncbi:MAG: hypothetical protein PHZ25_01750 [Candidatus Pacebacteria bacterium]|nr:hypothetical protein [Candidatus Paceibacterota bacterium]